MTRSVETFCPAIRRVAFNRDGAPFDPAEFAKPLYKDAGPAGSGRSVPGCTRRSAEKRNGLVPLDAEHGLPARQTRSFRNGVAVSPPPMLDLKHSTLRWPQEPTALRNLGGLRHQVYVADGSGTPSTTGAILPRRSPAAARSPAPAKMAYRLVGGHPGLMRGMQECYDEKRPSMSLREAGVTNVQLWEEITP
jgi:hypothetical protein